MEDPLTSPSRAPDAVRTLAATGFSIQRREGAWRDALRRRMLALADVAAVVAGSVTIAGLASGGAGAALWWALFAPVWLVLAKLLDLYDRDQRSLRHLTIDELPRVFMWAVVGTAVAEGLLTLTPAHGVSAGATRWVVGAMIVAAIVARTAVRVAWRRVTPPERGLIIGDGVQAAAARRKLELFPDIHVEVAATIPRLTAEELRWHPETLDGIDRVLVATSTHDNQLIAELLEAARRRQIKVSVVPELRGMFGTAVALGRVADLPVIEYNTWHVSRSTLLLKRIVDVVLASVGLLLALPLLVVVALAIWRDSGRPVFFTQTRAGQAGRPFTIVKFRTMVQDAEELLPSLVAFDALDQPMFKLESDPRVTRLGRLLRRWSIDELPQLLNVLRGDMSMVGPRPEEVALVERYDAQQRIRLTIRPGLTGPMQVYGRGRLSFDERLAVEREYIENISLTRDLRILAMTASSVLHGHGAF